MRRVSSSLAEGPWEAAGFVFWGAEEAGFAACPYALAAVASRMQNHARKAPMRLRPAAKPVRRERKLCGEGKFRNTQIRTRINAGQGKKLNGST